LLTQRKLLIGFHKLSTALKMHNKSLKQTGRANAAIEHFYFAGLFRGSIVFWSAPSGSLALR